MVRRHERQVNPVDILLVKDLDDVVSMAAVRPDPSPPWLLDALKAKLTKHGWFSQEAIAARREQRAALRALRAAAKKDDETMSGGAGVRGSIEGDI